MESNATTTSDSDILTKLQSPGEITGIDRLYAAHLNPLTSFLPPSNDHPAIAVRFKSIIIKSLALIAERLLESPSKIPSGSAQELFACYRLCLDCYGVILPELELKSHSLQAERKQLVQCLEHWGMFQEAETEGFKVLESLNPTASGCELGKSTRLVPETVDPEVAPIVLDIIITLLKCASKSRGKTNDYYRKVIYLVDQSEPLFRSDFIVFFISDAFNGYLLVNNCLNNSVVWRPQYMREKFHPPLEACLRKTALFLVEELKFFDVNLICDFSSVTLKSRSPDEI